VKDLLRIEYQEQTLTITVSMGVAAFPDHGPGIKDVVNAADTALYQAKAGGRDQVVVASL
jgi:diguanylate cyclase (GGDEF)-like protein